MSYENLRFFVYARKSTDGEDRQVRSLPDQGSVNDALIERERLSVVGRYEESKSAKHPYKRPQFTEMINRIVAGEADGILCWHVNRLARNAIEAGIVIQLLQEKTIKCIKTPDRVYLPEDNMLPLYVELGMANQYSNDLGRDIRRTLAQKATDGWWPYRMPLGYRLNPETKQIEAHPERFPLVRRAWDLMLTGSYTVPQIWRELNSWGLRIKKKGGTFGEIAQSSLYRHFRNPFYYGAFPFEGELQQGKHPPLVSRAEFDLVQQILGRPGSIQPQKYEFPFTGLIRCGRCGCVVTAEKKFKRSKQTGQLREYIYYHCTGKRGCAKTSIKEESLDAQIAALVRTCRLSLAVADWTRAAIQRDDYSEPTAVATIEGNQVDELTSLEDRLETLYEMRERKEITSEEFVERKNGLRTKINKLTNLIDKRRRDYEASVKATDQRLRQAPGAYERFITGDIRTKRQIATVIAASYSLQDGILRITPDPVFDAIRRFEPLLRRSQQVQVGAAVRSNSVLWRFLEDIRKIVREGDVCKSPEIPRTHLNYVHDEERTQNLKGRSWQSQLLE